MLGNYKDKYTYSLLAIIYLIFWIIVYKDLSAPGFFMSIIIILLQFKSFKWSILIYILVIFIPFFVDDFLGPGALRLNRLTFFPVLLYGLKADKVNKFHFDKKLLILLIISFFLIRISSDYQRITQESEWTIQNSIASWFDLISYFLFFYIIFTRLSVKTLEALILYLLFLSLLEGITLLYLVYDNPSLLYNYISESILWNNPFFDHKNFWGVFFAFVALIALAKLQIPLPKKKRLYLQIILVTAIALLLVSLSRRAIGIFIIGILYTSIAKGQYKLLFASAGIFIIIFFLDLDFLSGRFSSLIEARSFSDLQAASSGQLRDRAFQQFTEYFSIIPPVFVKPFEYNYLEGFWTGLLYQLGAFGMIYNVVILLYIFLRYNRYTSINNESLKNYSLLIMMFCVIFFFGSFSLRSMFFLDYYGNLKQTGILVLFIIYYSELLIGIINNQKIQSKLISA